MGVRIYKHQTSRPSRRPIGFGTCKQGRIRSERPTPVISQYAISGPAMLNMDPGNQPTGKSVPQFAAAGVQIAIIRPKSGGTLW
jgi:hypothetical protein